MRFLISPSLSSQHFILCAMVWLTPIHLHTQTIAPEVAVSRTTGAVVPASGTARQQAYLQSTLMQRMRIAERLGDDGARSFARAKGWRIIFDGLSRDLPQGPDQVYKGVDDVVHVIEAKGGTSPLRNAYGHPQGSTEWAVESAKRVLGSSKASAVEKKAATCIIDAATKGNLQVHVVRTSHRLGEPVAAVLESTSLCSHEATRLARALSATPQPTAIAKTASRTTRNVLNPRTAKLARAGSKAIVPVAIAIDAGVRVSDAVETERRFQNGEITVKNRERAHGRNIAGMVGGWGGAIAGAKIGAAGGGGAGTFLAPGPGTAVGGVAGGVLGGVAGYFGGEAVAENASDWTIQRFHSAGTTVSETASGAWDAVKDAGSWVKRYSYSW